MQVESRDELHSAQHAQRVLHELRRDVPQHAALQIVDAAVRILERIGERIVVHRVDGEVAPARGLTDGEERIGIYEEALVADAALRLPAWQRHVDVEVLDLHHAEGEPALVEREALAYDALQTFGLEAVHFKVNVLHRAVTKKEIAHGAAHH